MTATHATLTPKQLAEHVVDEAEARRVLEQLKYRGWLQVLLFLLWYATCSGFVAAFVQADPIVKAIIYSGLGFAGYAALEWSRTARRLKAVETLLEIEQARRAR